jgi:hypothetical protein
MKHRHGSKKEIREESDIWSGEFGQYQFILSKDSHNCELSMYKEGQVDHLRVGIMRCHPRSVEELEVFAEDCRELLLHIAKEIRALGFDDLRSDFEKKVDEQLARYAQ